MKKNKERSNGLSAFPSGDPAIMHLPELEDGRYNEWQDRGRVNLERANASDRTNLERDFEPERTRDDRNDHQKFY